MEIQDYYPTASSYADLCHKIYGKSADFINGIIWLKQLGPCVAYLFFISSHLD